MNLLKDLLPGTVDLPPLRGVAVFVVGEQLNANLTDEERLSCTGAFMRSLCNLAGFQNHMMYLRAASMRRNLFRPGQVMMEETAAQNADLLMAHFSDYETHYAEQLKSRQVLLCGAWARRAFGLRGEYGRQSAGKGAITWIPHPSGRNYFYNNPDSRRRVSELVQLAFNHAL